MPNHLPASLAALQRQVEEASQESRGAKEALATAQQELQAAKVRGRQGCLLLVGLQSITCTLVACGTAVGPLCVLLFKLSSV